MANVPVTHGGRRRSARTTARSDLASRQGMSRFLLPIVWVAWGIAYPLMGWSLEAVDLFSGRLIIMPLSGVILLAVGVWGGAPALPDRHLWGQIALTGFFNMGLFQIFLISGIATLWPSRTPLIIFPIHARFA